MLLGTRQTFPCQNCLLLGLWHCLIVRTIHKDVREKTCQAQKGWKTNPGDDIDEFRFPIVIQNMNPPSSWNHYLIDEKV